jgi:transcription elongation factor
MVEVEYPELVGNERDLIGATIRIKKGRYKGLTGVIEESNTLRRIQLDTVDVPMGLDNVEILWYEPQQEDDNNTNNDNNNTKKKKYVNDKYLGAKVRVKPPHPDSGKLGRIIKVVILGNWYITNNPAIKTAFPSSKFDILRYANGDVPVIDMLDDDSDVLV